MAESELGQKLAELQKSHRKLQARANAERKAFRKELEAQFEQQVEQVTGLKRENKNLARRLENGSSEQQQQLSLLEAERDKLISELETRTNELTEATALLHEEGESQQLMELKRLNAELRAQEEQSEEEANNCKMKARIYEEQLDAANAKIFKLQNQLDSSEQEVQHWKAVGESSAQDLEETMHRNSVLELGIAELKKLECALNGKVDLLQTSLRSTMQAKTEASARHLDTEATLIYQEGQIIEAHSEASKWKARSDSTTAQLEMHNNILSEVTQLKQELALANTSKLEMEKQVLEQQERIETLMQDTPSKEDSEPSIQAPQDRKGFDPQLEDETNSEKDSLQADLDKNEEELKNENAILSQKLKAAEEDMQQLEALRRRERLNVKFADGQVVELEGKLIEQEALCVSYRKRLDELEEQYTNSTAKETELAEVGALSKVTLTHTKQSLADAVAKCASLQEQVAVLETKIEVQAVELKEMYELQDLHKTQADEMEKLETIHDQARQKEAAVILGLKHSLESTEAQVANLEGQLITTDARATELAKRAKELEQLEDCRDAQGRESRIKMAAEMQKLQAQGRAAKSSVAIADGQVVELEGKLIETQARLEFRLAEAGQVENELQNLVSIKEKQIEELEAEKDRREETENALIVSLKQAEEQLLQLPDLKLAEAQALEKYRFAEDRVTELEQQLSELQEESALASHLLEEAQHQREELVAHHTCAIEELHQKLIASESSFAELQVQVTESEGHLLQCQNEIVNLLHTTQKQDDELDGLQEKFKADSMQTAQLKEYLLDSEGRVNVLEGRSVELEGDVCSWMGRAELHAAQLQQVHRLRSAETTLMQSMKSELVTCESRIIELEGSLIEQEGEAAKWCLKFQKALTDREALESSMIEQLDTSATKILEKTKKLEECERQKSDWEVKACESAAQIEDMQKQRDSDREAIHATQADLNAATLKLEQLQALVSRVASAEQLLTDSDSRIDNVEMKLHAVQQQQDFVKKTLIEQTAARHAAEEHGEYLEGIVEEYSDRFESLLESDKEMGLGADALDEDASKDFMEELHRIRELSVLGAQGTAQLHEEHKELKGQVHYLQVELEKEQDHSRELLSLLDATEETDDFDQAELDMLRHENSVLRAETRIEHQTSVADLTLPAETQEAFDALSGFNEDGSTLDHVDKAELWKRLEKGIWQLKADLAQASEEVMTMVEPL